MATLCQQQDGGLMLLCKRYVNNKMAAMRYYGKVILHAETLLLPTDAHNVKKHRVIKTF